MRHTPIMVNEIVHHCLPSYSLMVDGTLGHGGHTEAILKTLPNLEVIGIDLDPQMLDVAKEHLANTAKRFRPFLGSYADIEKALDGELADYILLDIGVNMQHFTDPARGFSLNQEGPLDMRFSPSNPVTASAYLRSASLTELTDILQNYADYYPRTRADFVAKKIIRHRNGNPLLTTGDLKILLHACDIPFKAMPPIFQAVRIAVNKELEQLEKFLEVLPNVLNVGGRCAIISFHSVEDRIVKNAFEALVEAGGRKLVNKKVITPHYKEVLANRASRSAKLRIIEKL